MMVGCIFFFFQAEDGIRDLTVTGVQTCALPIYLSEASLAYPLFQALRSPAQNAVPLRVSDHGLHTGELNLVQRLVHRRRDRKLVELQKQEIALIDAIGRGILAQRSEILRIEMKIAAGGDF